MNVPADTTRQLVARIDKALNEECGVFCRSGIGERPVSGLSVVLFLLGMAPQPGSRAEEPCLILNKRSNTIKQPGDLCCPGGGVSFHRDRLLSRFLTLPRMPLSRWGHWRDWQKNCPERTALLRLYLATGLREAFEEMRMNPLSLTFLGPLPEQRLVLFDRTICPLAGWISGRKRFVLNHEVDKLVCIPIKQLRNEANYFRYRLKINTPDRTSGHGREQDFPGFRHQDATGSEFLWGATFRITMDFLKIVFGFTPPIEEKRPIVHGIMRKDYLSGANHRKNG